MHVTTRDNSRSPVIALALLLVGALSATTATASAQEGNSLAEGCDRSPDVWGSNGEVAGSVSFLDGIDVTRVEAVVEAEDVGVLGTVPDRRHQRLLVVLERTATEPDINVASRALSGVNGADSIEVVVGCATTGELATARHNALDLIESLSLPQGSSIATFPDPASGRIVAIVDDPDGVGIGERLASTSGFVRVVSGEGGRASSISNDGSPHNGGAYIANDTNGCTANASATTSFLGLKVMPTAGHCVFQGSTTWASGSHTYGVNANEVGDFPVHDLGAMLQPQNQTYTDDMWVSSGTTADIRAIVHRTVKQGICLIGRRSGSLNDCSLLVSTSDDSGTFTDPLGTTYDLDYAVDDLASDTCEEGASGGPYNVSHSGGRAISGLHVAYTDAPAFGITVCAYHDANVVQAELGVSYNT